jgi:hypothetical protein
MSSDKTKDRTELRKEIKIAIFWRKLIGDLEYVKFDPDNVLRWHLAMDMRGDEDIRALMLERYQTVARRAPVLGIVGESPHPPAWIVREWLKTREPKFPKWRIFSLSFGFVVVMALLLPVMSGTQYIKPMNTMVLNPPIVQPNVMLPQGSQFSVGYSPATTPVPVQSISAVPSPVNPVLGFGSSPPASLPQMGAQPPAKPVGSGTTGPVNIGLSGSSAGSPAGTTGPTNTGASGTPPSP